MVRSGSRGVEAIVGWGLGVLVGLGGCRPAPVAEVPPAVEVPPDSPPPAQGEAVPAPPRPGELVPTVLAPYRMGSCDLVLRERHLYWLTKGFVDSPAKKARPSAPHRGGAAGAVLDCGRTRGTVWRLSTAPGAEAVAISEIGEWPWSLGASDRALYWVGYCSDGLFTASIEGGPPLRIGARDLSVIGHAADADTVVAVDRFGERRGVFRIDPSSDETTPIAARGQQPWLVGVRDGTVYWGTRRGERTAVRATGPGGHERALGSIAGAPMDAKVHGEDLFVLTTAAVVRIGDGDEIEELSRVVEYGDRGSLAVGDTYLYWANGKSGTVTRARRDGTEAAEAYLGGEPCGLVTDERFVYWLDRGRDAVMRVHRAWFDEPRPAPEPSPEPERPSRVAEGDRPPEGLGLAVKAALTEVQGGWGVDIVVEARVGGDKAFRVNADDPVSLSGTIEHRDGSGRMFRGRCVLVGPSSPTLTPGSHHVWSRAHRDGAAGPIGRGQRLTLDVELCRVVTADGERHRVRAATVVLDATGRGRPEVIVRPNVAEE